MADSPHAPSSRCSLGTGSRSLIRVAFLDKVRLHKQTRQAGLLADSFVAMTIQISRRVQKEAADNVRWDSGLGMTVRGRS